MYKFKVGDLVCWRHDSAVPARGIVVGVVRLDRYRVQWFGVRGARIDRVCDLAKLGVRGE